VLPQDRVKRRPRVTQRERRPGVGDGGLDLAAVADDPGIAEQSLDVALVEASDALGIEAGKGAAERLALAENRDPGEPRLESLEAQALVETALVAHRPPPLLVVVGDVERVARGPAADRFVLQVNSLAHDPAGLRFSGYGRGRGLRGEGGAGRCRRTNAAAAAQSGYSPGGWWRRSSRWSSARPRRLCSSTPARC